MQKFTPIDIDKCIGSIHEWMKRMNYSSHFRDHPYLSWECVGLSVVYMVGE